MNLTDKLFLLRGYGGDYVVRVWRRWCAASPFLLFAARAPDTTPPPYRLCSLSSPAQGDVPALTLADGTVIPPQNFHDGPQGVANGNNDVTAWPSALTVVMSWSTDMMGKFGAGMGLEQYRKGSTVMLGPGVNLARVPWNGRNL